MTIGDLHKTAIDPQALTLDDFLGKMAGTRSILERPDGTRLRVVVAGEGPKVILLEHGFAMSADFWRILAPALVDHGYRVVAYDRRGHGESTVGSQGFASKALREDLKAVAEHFQVEDAVLVCHSMGNFVALGALPDENFRRRFRFAVLVSPTTGDSAKGTPLVRMSAPLMRMGVMQKLSRVRSIGRKLAALQCGTLATEPMLEATRLALCGISTSLSPLNHVLMDESVVGDLPAVGIPLHVLSGTDDKTTPGWHARLIVSKAPHAKVTYVDGTGHMLPWENPEVIVRSIVDEAALA